MCEAQVAALTALALPDAARATILGGNFNRRFSQAGTSTSNEERT